MKKLSSIIAVVLFLSLFLVGGAFAVPVQYTNVGPGGTINIGGTLHPAGLGVYAGIYNLLVNSVATDSFCIDLEDNSTGAVVNYNVVALKDAADPAFGPMGATAAHDVSVLWALGYAAAKTSNEAAVSLQVAIWEVVADVNNGYDLSQGAFTAIDAGAANLLAGIANFQGTPANLVGLSNNTYQDYVTQQVPEPFSMLLLGLGLLGVAGVRRVSKK